MRAPRQISAPRGALRRLGLSLALAAGAALAAAGLAAATTGPGYLINAPKYRIPLPVIKAYSGRYVSTSAAHASGIQSSEVYIGIAESGYAAGGISIYRYNAAGTLETFAGTLYNFRLVGARIEADIVGPGGRPVLGHLTFAHAPGSKNLTGTIQPPGSTGRYAIAYRYAASGGPLPGQSNAPVPGPPNIGTVHGNSGTGTVQPKSVAGWGPTGDFLGRYHLIPGTPAVPASQPAGIFTVALNAASRLSAAAQVPTSGQLSMFMRTVKKTIPPEPSGILSLQAPSGSEVVYLTGLTSAGLARRAQVHGGSFLGPQIGTFSGTRTGVGKLSGRLSASGIGTFTVSFTRFSDKPAP